MAFQKGQSGNPNGKPKGTRHRATMAAETLMEGEAEAITRMAIELAKGGDGPAIAQTVTSPLRVLWRAIVNGPSEKRLQRASLSRPVSACRPLARCSGIHSPLRRTATR